MTGKNGLTELELSKTLDQEAPKMKGKADEPAEHPI